jgi:predicted GIY-YIG superfamily endonuclease
MHEDGPQWLYRIYDSPKGKVLLYIGVTDSLSRRIGQHVRGKEWFPPDGRITFVMYAGRASVLAAEEAAIRRERPVHNIQHNIRIELAVRADFNLTGNGLFAMTAAVLGACLLLKWGSDAYAVRRVRVLAERQGIEHESPKVACPFTENPMSTPAKLFWTALLAASVPPPPRIVPGDPKSLEAFAAWQKAMAPVGAIWDKSAES